MGPVAQLVFKTSAVVQPTARSVRLRRRSVSGNCASLRGLRATRRWIPRGKLKRWKPLLTAPEGQRLSHNCPAHVVLGSPAMSADEGLAKVEEAQAQLRAILFPDEHGGGMRDDLGHPLGAQLLELHRLLGEAVERLRA
jgi:hypothetical protein